MKSKVITIRHQIEKKPQIVAYKIKNRDLIFGVLSFDSFGYRLVYYNSDFKIFLTVFNEKSIDSPKNGTNVIYHNFKTFNRYPNVPIISIVPQEKLKKFNLNIVKYVLDTSGLNECIKTVKTFNELMIQLDKLPMYISIQSNCNFLK